MLVYPTGIPTGAAGYTIENAIWLDGSSDYLNKTFSGTSTNLKKFTFSCWFKLGALGATGTLFSCDDTSSDNEFMFWVESGGNIRIANYVGGSNKLNLITTPLFRDPTAWYHLILEADSTPSTPSSASIKLWINGVQVTAFSTETYPSQNFDFALGNSFDHEVGRYALSDNNLWNGYIAEMVFIDGTDYTYTDFGEFDDNGVWVPIDPSGLTFGTNGFYLDFSLSPARQTGMTASNTGTSFVDFNAANTVDNDPTSKAFRLAHGVTGQQLDLDMGSGNTLNLKQVGMYMDNSGSNGQGATWSVFYSDNGSDYTDTSEDITYTDNSETSSTEVRKALASDHGAHRYWRLTVSATSVPSEPPSSGAIYGVNLYDVGLGKDASGQNNHFTENSFTVANQVTDTCTDDANNNVGNYATFNAIDRHGSTTLSNGNLHANGTTTHEAQIRTTIALTGKKYWEIEADTLNADAAFIGILKTNTDITTMNNHSLGTTADGYSINCSTGSNNGKLFNNNTNGTDLGTIANGDVISVAFDADTRKLFFGKNGSWLGSADPANGTNPAYTASVGTYTAAVSVYTTSSLFKANFGQTAFSYTVPTGFDAGINTANLPAPTVTKPSDFFKTVLYTGNGSDKSVTGVGFQPDFVWLKCRSVATNWNVVDVVRGADAMLRMASSTNAEQSGANQEFESFDADGFTVTHHGGVVEELNRSSETYVAYCMKAGGAASSNGNGSITSQVSAASHGGFSIITYTGNGSAGATIGHGLSKAAEFQIFKRRTPAQDYHIGTNITGSIIGAEFNNPTNSIGGGAVGAAVTAFNATTTALDAQGVVNDLNDTYVSYAFARTPGLIGIGTYAGNNSTDGTYVIIDDGASGFRPAWVMLKNLNDSENWVIFDSARSPTNQVDGYLSPNTTAGDGSATGLPLDFTANGFKHRNHSNMTNEDTILYLAFAEHPFGGDTVAQGRAR